MFSGVGDCSTGGSGRKIGPGIIEGERDLAGGAATVLAALVQAIMSSWRLVGAAISWNPQHVWAIVFLFDQTMDGGLKYLNVIDEYSRVCLAIRVGR